jgi:hypothetical protein
VSASRRLAFQYGEVARCEVGALDGAERRAQHDVCVLQFKRCDRLPHDRESLQQHID